MKKKEFLSKKYFQERKKYLLFKSLGIEDADKCSLYKYKIKTEFIRKPQGVPFFTYNPEKSIPRPMFSKDLREIYSAILINIIAYVRTFKKINISYIEDIYTQYLGAKDLFEDCNQERVLRYIYDKRAKDCDTFIGGLYWQLSLYEERQDASKEDLILWVIKITTYLKQSWRVKLKKDIKELNLLRSGTDNYKISTYKMMASKFHKEKTLLETAKKALGKYMPHTANLTNKYFSLITPFEFVFKQFRKTLKKGPLLMRDLKAIYGRTPELFTRCRVPLEDELIKLVNGYFQISEDYLYRGKAPPIDLTYSGGLDI